MNRTALTVAMLATGGATLASATSAASASEPACFVKTASGQVIDLASLCGATPVVTPTSRSISAPERMPSRPSLSKFEVVSVKPVYTSQDTARQLARRQMNRPAQQANQVDQWQRAAQSAIAMSPYWSGHCRVGSRPCQMLSTRVQPRRSRSRVAPQPLIFIIQLNETSRLNTEPLPQVLD